LLCFENISVLDSEIGIVMAKRYRKFCDRRWHVLSLRMPEIVKMRLSDEQKVSCLCGGVKYKVAKLKKFHGAEKWLKA